MTSAAATAIRPDSLATESGMSLSEVIEHRLALAAKHLKWSPLRISAFRQGYSDGRKGRIDDVRKHRHGEDDSFLESSLSPELVDALGYRDGVQAAEALSAEITDYAGNKEAVIEWANYWADNGDNDFDIDEASWSYDAAQDLSLFLKVMDRDAWISWFTAEHEAAIEAGRDGYGDLLIQDIQWPAVFVDYPDGKLDVWDGFHRIGAAMLKGAGVIPAIRGVPAPAPQPVGP